MYHPKRWLCAFFKCLSMSSNNNNRVHHQQIYIFLKVHYSLQALNNMPFLSRILVSFHRNCLSRIREETYAIKASVKASWAEISKNNIQDKDNVVIYAGESPDGEDSNKNFVQMKKKRPGWFQRHLLS